MRGNGFEHVNSLVKILLNASVSVDEGSPVSTLNMNTVVALKLAENLLHRLYIDGFDCTVGIQEKLESYRSASE